MLEFRARWIVPVAAPPIEGGSLCIDRGRIAYVGRNRGGDGRDIFDLGDVILLPGFVNAHTHLELTCYRGRVPEGPLWEWIDRLVALRRQPEAADRERAGIAEGVRQSLAAGVTCVGDISRTGMNVEALDGLPIRKVCFVELISGASNPPTDAAELEAILQRLRERESDRLVLSVSPHAPYSVTALDLRNLVEFARRRALRPTMHVLETSDEQAWLQGRPCRLADWLRERGLPAAANRHGGGIVSWLAESGLLDLGPILAHVNYADNATLAGLAATSASVAWCPRTHAFFRHPPHRWREMLAAGINVCVGTDSLASNDSLSILDELRFIRRTVPDIAPAVLLSMGTLSGARALGLGHTIGSLESGKRADLVAVRCAGNAARDPVTDLLDGNEPVEAVWVDGDRIDLSSLRRLVQ